MTSLVNYPDPGLGTKTAWLQIGYGVWVNMNIVGTGLAYGFSAVAIPQFHMHVTPVTTTQAQEAWIASVLNLSSPIGCILNGYIQDRYGRRIALVLCQVPSCAGWIYTSAAKTATSIIIGRVITGIGAGMAMIPPRVYTAEICLPNMRGVVGAFPSLFSALGLTIQAGLGALLSWKTIAFICAGYSLVNLIANAFLPESPYYLLMKNNSEEAKYSLLKFRGNNYNVDVEFEEMIDFKDNNDIHKLSTIAQIQALFTAAACKSFWIIITYVIITQVAGCNIIISWAVEILEASQININAFNGNIILGISRMISAVFTSVLFYKYAKKPLTLVSSVGVGASCIGLYLHLEFGTKNAVPIICWISYIFFSSLGHYSLPYLMMSELYPLQIRGLLSGITVALSNVFIFFSLKLFPEVRDSIGFNYTILAFGLSSLLGGVILYFILPETKDLTLQEIEEYLNRRRPSLMSQRAIQSKSLSSNKTQIDKGSSSTLKRKIADTKTVHGNKQQVPEKKTNDKYPKKK